MDRCVGTGQDVEDCKKDCVHDTVSPFCSLVHSVLRETDCFFVVSWSVYWVLGLWVFR